jgi:hypothetical protein
MQERTARFGLLRAMIGVFYLAENFGFADQHRV